VASNVHGGEESGTDASLRVLHELADRDDCAARQILDNAIVVLLPIQNPDGRELDTRRNVYGFDMNRDWFARTQPETDGKLELLRRYPGPLFIDAHEMGRATYFFPPNADPIYHEIADAPIDWINNVYGAAMAAEFNRQGIPFFNRDLYDLFYMGYGDTVPATGFISAGMTFEKASGDPIAQRANEQYLTQWVSLSQGAIRKRAILEQWASAWREAYAQGVAGKLEPNEVVNPGNEVVTQVPDRPVRHYFIDEQRSDKQREVQALIRRLQRMDVDVYAPAPASAGAGLHPLRAPLARDRPARRHVVGAAGPDAEALGPGDAPRGQLHAVPLLLRRDGVEPAAALQRERGLLGRAAATQRQESRPACRTGRPATARRASRCGRSRRPRRRPSSRQAGCATC
jgi:hypothetical protein